MSSRHGEYKIGDDFHWVRYFGQVRTILLLYNNLTSFLTATKKEISGLTEFDNIKNCWLRAE